MKDIQQEIQEINEINKETKRSLEEAEHNYRIANRLSVVAIILSVIALVIRLLIAKGWQWPL